MLACSQRVRIFVRLCALALVFLTEKILAYLKAHKAGLYPFKMLQNIIKEYKYRQSIGILEVISTKSDL